MIKLCNLKRFTFRVLSGCCFLAVTAFSAHAQPLTFTTFAGPSGGPGSVDGAGAAASFNHPSDVAADSSGNFYVADSFNFTIRKITPAGVVTTLAGSAGLSGSANGTGSAARFNFPRGVATDSAGNVYVADRDNETIRKITPAGVVTTLAGSVGFIGTADGTGGAAGFNTPTGLATDSGGNVYVADRDNDTIRKITPAGVVTTFAGSAGLFGSADGTGSAARFNHPRGVATDSGGNVYVADEFNYTIRKITPAGVVTTLAGSAGLFGSADGIGSAARFESPRGLATDSGGNVYVSDSGNATIRKITAAGVVTTLAGSPQAYGSEDGTGSAARFGLAYASTGLTGMATDSGGNVYVSDSDNATIRRITPAGVVTTLAGSPLLKGSEDGTGSAARFNHPTGVATDSSGSLYVADRENYAIRKITPAGVVTTLSEESGEAHGVATDSSGNVYVANDYTIRKITPAGMVTILAGSVGEQGSANGTGSAARFNFPEGVATDSSGNVYVADTTNCTIRKITPAGVVTTLAGSPISIGSADGTGSAARFYFPSGVATDIGGNVYVADSYNDTIRKITPAGVVTTLAGLVFHSGSADGTGSAARFYLPSGVATDSSGNVYVADSGNGTIRKITPGGVVSTLAGSPGIEGNSDGTGSAARFSPDALATDSNGNVYVADSFHNSIRIGRPALTDAATIDFSTGIVGTTRQLTTTTQTATSWQWTPIRRPAASAAVLSSTSIRNPVFTPDVPDLYIFQLTASNGVRTSITTISLTATPVSSRRRSVGH